MGWGLLSISLQLATNIGKLGHNPYYNNQHTELNEKSPMKQFSSKEGFFISAYIHIKKM